MTTTTSGILQQFLRRLTNLGGNNRSLFLPRLHAEQLLDVQLLSFLKGEKAFSLINALIAGKSKALCQVLDSRMESNNKVSQRIKRLQRLDSFLFEERGSKDLHIGWPFVHGKFNDGTLVRCPLLFFPVVIKQLGADWVLQPREDAGITFNKTFLLAYSFYNQVGVEEDLLDYSFEDSESDSTVFRTQLYQLLREKVELNFNAELFADEVAAFTEFTKSEFDEKHKIGELKLQPEAVLGIFPQAGSQLIPDYVDMIRRSPGLELENVFSNLHQVSDSPRIVKEENSFTPLLLDEWQEDAILKIKNGKSLVVQGPPGTGKSQLISNIISDAIATGKKVLLVCQKRVALDVVYERLSALGLKNFVGLVHDYRNDRKEIFSTIASQIDSVQDFKNLNRSIDVIQVERQFYQLSRSIDGLTEELEEFRSALFQEEECGLSAKQLYLTSNPTKPAINIKQEYPFFDFRNLSSFIQVMKRHIRYAARFESDAYPWKHRISLAHVEFGEMKRRMNSIEALFHFKYYFEERTQSILGVVLSVEDGESLLTNLSSIKEIISSISDPHVFRFFTTMVGEQDEETSLLWVDNLRLLCMNCFDGEGIESTLPADQLVKFQSVLQKRMEARRRSFIRLLQWEWFSEDKYWLKRVLVANKLEYNRKHLQILEARLDNRLNLEHHLTALRGKPWLTDLPATINAQELLRWFDAQKKAIQTKLLFTSLREVQQYISPTRFTQESFAVLLEQLTSVLTEIVPAREKWDQALSAYQIRALLNDPSLKETLLKTLQTDFEDLVAYDELRNQLSANEKAVIEKLYQEVQHWDETAFIKLFQNSLRLEWLNHLEAKYPVLRLVSTQRFEEMERELQEAVVQKKKLTKELLLLRVRERVYEHIEYNRLNNPVTYRDLEHQVTKKKKIWPLRKVISSFHHELFDLMPCWMASPESVSAIFPLEQLFDIVIFDEASQCFAERGIPAMQRGKQVVVAGDSQQLQPSDLYQIRWSEENAENPDSEVDSLLELSARYLPTVHLQGHYRSHSQELIEFSNKHFYKNRLKMLPSFEGSNNEESSIHFVKVDGIWENQVNEAEAQAVVEQVLVYTERQPDKTIGVITFNAPQQQLIWDKLEAAFAERQILFPPSLMVKNIENVQGDEKDVVIFSIGYAPDKKGKFNLQFGSLSVAGGENRLNVAVTRAKERIVVVSSIWPEQLDVDEVKNEGPKLLRKYLEYVRSVSSGQQMLLPFEGKAHNSEWYLSSKLYSDHTQLSTLPFSDMVVSRLYKPEALVLTDDEYYRNSLSAKAAHAYTLLLLERKGWRFKRIFSRHYWLNPEQVLLEVQKLLN